MIEAKQEATRVTALGVSRWLIYYAERLCAGVDVAEVLDEVTAHCLKARERIERRTT